MSLQTHTESVPLELNNEAPSLSARYAHRAAPAGLHVDISMGWHPSPRDCQCLDISQHGMTLVCDLPYSARGDYVVLNLWSCCHMLLGVTGRVARVEGMGQLAKLSIVFDSPYAHDPDLRALIEN